MAPAWSAENPSRALRLFLETTSVKGVPKAVKSPTQCLRCLWSVALIFGCCVAIIFLLQLFTNYFMYSANLQLSQEPVTAQDFPDITLCNLNPFANSPYGVQDINQLFDIMENKYNPAIRVYLGDPNYNIFDIPQYQDLLRPGKMLEYVAGTLPEAGYNETRNFLLHCEWDTDISGYDCMNSVEIRLHTTDFGYCFTFRRPEASTRVAGFSAILYLDSFSFVTHMPAFPVGLGDVFTDGARVVLHPPLSQPVLTEGLNIEAGYHTTLTVNVDRIQKLGPPYSDCHHDPNVYMCWPDVSFATDKWYGRQQCEDFCFQKSVTDSCACITGTRLSMYDMRRNHSFCGDQNHKDPMQIIHNVNAMLQCYTGIPHTQCPTPCSEDQYGMTLYRSQWPHPAYHVTFYEDYIANQSYADAFAIYRNISLITDKGHAFKLLQRTDLIRSNFLQVNVIFRDDTVTLLREHEALSMESLIGNLGGVLNLWVGITFMTVIEICELLINCCVKPEKKVRIAPKQQAGLGI